MLAEFIAWALALILATRFLADHVVFPIIGTILHLMEPDEPEVDTHAMGFDLSPSDYDDEDDWDEDEEDRGMGFKLTRKPQ